MGKPVKKNVIRISFEIGLLLKGMFALGETAAGIAMVFLSPARMSRLVGWISRNELKEDPTDWLMSHLVLFGNSFSRGEQRFAVFYMLSHGIIKLAVVALLWRGKLWAYPLSALVFAGFIVYQIRQFSSSGSVMLIILTVLDIAMIALTILEYRRRRAAGAR